MSGRENIRIVPRQETETEPKTSPDVFPLDPNRLYAQLQGALVTIASLKEVLEESRQQRDALRAQLTEVHQKQSSETSQGDWVQKQRNHLYPQQWPRVRK